MASIVDRFLVCWLKGGRYRWSKMRRWLCERGYLKNPLPTVISLEDIENRLKQVTWTMDGPLHLYDSISYPEVTWTKKKDDCDGFASLAAALLNQLDEGYAPALLTVMVRPLRRSHTVCAFKAPSGGLWFFDNASLRRVECQGYADIAGLISESVDRLVCWDVRDPATLEMIEFHR
jgi:hypothetical protein